jgi:BirA family transcriptional regulator, biotin operon repressor / biotin---[acetyl-CoA-carboxylase] ligase
MIHATSELPASLARALAARRGDLGPFGAAIRWHACIGSTNDDAARWAADGAPEGAVVVADEQTDGRGRRGRGWTSPPGAGLYMSIVFRPDSRPGPVPGLDPRSGTGSRETLTPLLTLMAGVAVASGVRLATGVPVTLKWPNDVIVEAEAIGSEHTGGRDAAPRRWRKVAGILAEAATSGNALQFVVLGVGVNLRSADWPPDVAARATSLAAVSNGAIDRDGVLVSILAAMASEYRRMLDGGRSAMLEDWRRLSPSSRGRTVVRDSATGPATAVTAGVDAEGALLVDGPHGRERIVAGELVWE